MRVFVTGASGWIGSAVVPELIEAGHTVTGLARSPQSAAALEAAGAHPVEGSLDDLETLRAAADRADAAIHLAFKHEQAFSGDFAVAAEADRHAIETLGGTGNRLVIASGLAGHPSGRLVDEDDAPEAGSPRARNEQIALDRGGVSVRLSPTVHGDGDNGFIAMFVDAARRNGVSGYPGDGSGTWPAVHRFDAARLFRLALESAAPGSVLHGAAEEGVPLKEIAEAIGDGLGLPTNR